MPRAAQTKAKTRIAIETGDVRTGDVMTGMTTEDATETTTGAGMTGDVTIADETTDAGEIEVAVVRATDGGVEADPRTAESERSARVGLARVGSPAAMAGAPLRRNYSSSWCSSSSRLSERAP